MATSTRRRLLVVGLALAALLLLAVAAAPSLAGAFLPSRVEAAFAERFHGRLEVGDLDLGWGGRQRVEGVRLLDPQGGEVARVAAELPGLWALLAGRGKDLGHVRVVVSADLAADAEGKSNLERALEPRVAPGEPGPGGGGEGGGSPLEDLECDLELVVERLTWSDARTSEPFVLEDFAARATLDGAGAAVVESAGRIQGGAEDGLKVTARAQHLFARAGAAEPPTIEVDATLRDLPLGLVDALAGQGGRLRDLLGERATLRVQASGTASAGTGELALTGERAELRAALEARDGVLRGRGDAALAAELRLPLDVWNARVAPLLPPDVAVTPAGEGLTVRATVSAFALPLAVLVDAVEGDEVVSRALAEAEVALALDLTGATLASTALAQPLPWTAANVRARLAARALELELAVQLAGSGDSRVSVRASCADAAALLAAADGRGAAPIGLQLVATRLDSALVTSALGEGPAAEVFGERFDLKLDVDGTLALAGPSAARVALDLTTRGRTLGARLDVKLPEGPAAAPLELSGEVGGLAIARPLVPARWREAADELLGETLALELATRAAPGDTLELDGSLRAARVQARFALAQGPGGIAARGERGLELTASPSNATLARELAASLPAGARVEWLEDGAAATLVVRELSWPSVAPTEGVDPLAAALERARVDLALALPGLRIVSPGATPEAAPVPVELAGLSATVALAPEGGLSVRAVSRLPGASEDTLRLSLAVPRPGEWMAEDTSAAEFAVELSCKGLPTALVDALAAQDGLVVDVLGASADVEFRARRPGGEEGLTLALRSPTASLDLVGSLEDGVLRSRESGRLAASMPLTPLYTKRIVGGLLPMLVGLAKDEGAPPATLALSNFALPLDGDLRKLDGDLKLDLNQVSYRLVPGFADFVASLSGAEAGPKSFVLPPISISVRQGVVRYDALPITLAGQALTFAGSFDLATRELDLSTEIPLSLLGETVAAQLEKARLALDPATKIPLRLSGTPRKPKITIPREFLESTLKDAALDAAKRGLGDLLDKALKKDG
jgi:hypothetical protein